MKKIIIKIKITSFLICSILMLNSCATMYIKKSPIDMSNHTPVKIYTYVKPLERQFRKTSILGANGILSDNEGIRKACDMSTSNESIARNAVLFVAGVCTLGLFWFEKVRYNEINTDIDSKSVIDALQTLVGDEIILIDVTQNFKNEKEFIKKSKKAKNDNFYMFFKFCILEDFPRKMDTRSTYSYIISHIYNVNVIAGMTKIYHNKKKIMDYREHFMPQRLLRTGDNTSIFENQIVLITRCLENLSDNIKKTFKIYEFKSVFNS